jgi:hypothetical protein
MMITIWAFLLLIGLQYFSESKIHERRVRMEFDVSMMAEHKGSGFSLVPHIEGAVKKIFHIEGAGLEDSKSNSTNDNKLSATPALFENESLERKLIQLKEDLSIQQFSCPTERVAASLITETNIDWKMLIIFSAFFLLLMFSVTALRTPQHESDRLKPLKMTAQDEISRVIELAVDDSDDTQQPHELARIKHHYEGQILKLRSQLIDGATSLVTYIYICIHTYTYICMYICIFMHIYIYIYI